MLDRMFIESSNAMRRILYALAQRPTCWVTTTEIAEAAGLTPRQVVASFGPFEKRVRGRYGMSRWPFETRGFVDEGISKYSMFSATGSRIIALMSEVGGQEAGAT